MIQVPISRENFNKLLASTPQGQHWWDEKLAEDGYENRIYYLVATAPRAADIVEVVNFTAEGEPVDQWGRDKGPDVHGTEPFPWDGPDGEGEGRT